MNRYLPFAIIVVVFIIAVGGGAALYKVKLKQQRGRTAAAAAMAVKAASNGAEPAHMRGDTNAPVTLEEFGDFQCQPCGDLSPIIEKIEQDYGANLRVIFRQLPLAMHRHAL